MYSGEKSTASPLRWDKSLLTWVVERVLIRGCICSEAIKESKATQPYVRSFEQVENLVEFMSPVVRVLEVPESPARLLKVEVQFRKARRHEAAEHVFEGVKITNREKTAGLSRGGE